MSFSAAGVFGVTTLLYGLLSSSDGARDREHASLPRGRFERQPGFIVVGIDAGRGQLLWNGTF